MNDNKILKNKQNSFFQFKKFQNKKKWIIQGKSFDYLSNSFQMTSLTPYEKLLTSWEYIMKNNNKRLNSISIFW